jgi:hypothetical protein
MPSIETTMALRQETPGNEGWMRSARAGDPNKYFVVSAVCHAKRSGRVRKMIPIWMLVLSLSFAAWADPGSDAGTSDEGPRILEFYYGLDMLPPLASLLCMTNVAGQDGAPVTFSVQLDGASVAPSDFIVETATGERVTPDCATLRPADEVLELRTVLLTGTFGTADSQPRAVEVVGVLQELNGAEFGGLRFEDVTPLEAGPDLVLAERYLPDNPGIGGECPPDSAQVVQLVWGGGVSGPAGTALGEPQRLGVSIQLEDGTTVQPTALVDDDPDNFVIACLDASSPAVEASVAPGLFHDPGDDANPATTVTVTDRTGLPVGPAVPSVSVGGLVSLALGMTGLAGWQIRKRAHVGSV